MAREPSSLKRTASKRVAAQVHEVFADVPVPRAALVAHLTGPCQLKQKHARALAAEPFMYQPDGTYFPLSRVLVLVAWHTLDEERMFVHAFSTLPPEARENFARERDAQLQRGPSELVRFVNHAGPMNAVPLTRVAAHHVAGGALQLGDRWDAPHWQVRMQWLAKRLFA